MEELSRDKARRILVHLKAGTTPIDCVRYVNVGNEKWYAAAEGQFDEIQRDEDSIVRFIRGYYGDGKTHFLGMLRSEAFNKGWMVAYVTAENTPLSKFDAVYSQLLKNLTLPANVVIPEWVSQGANKGAHGLLGALFYRYYFESSRMTDRSGLQKERILEALRHRVAQTAADPLIHENIGAALIAYVEAIIRQRHGDAHTVCSWLEGEAVKIYSAKITRRIDQKYARDATRSISVIAKRAGLGGVLVLLDEAERIMQQSRSVRSKSYGVLRDLLDNADDQGGMRSSIVYVAATPETFESERGFPEYDALRSRLQNSSKFSLPGIVDWRGVVVDLTKTPLPHDHLIQIAKRIVLISSTAREWNAREQFTDEVLNRVVAGVEQQAVAVSKPRLLASSVATLVELSEQNREVSVLDILDRTLNAVHKSLLAKPQATAWN